LVLIAAGQGAARVPTCEHTLRRAPTRVQERLTFDDDDQYEPAMFGECPQFRDGLIDYGPKEYVCADVGTAKFRVRIFYPVLVHALLPR
jgi:hypothetical protein